MLEVKITQFSYGERTILKDIHLELNHSQIIGLIAPNGTGKSTLVRIISGHIQSGGTQVTCNGKSYSKDTQYMRQQIVKMPDQSDLYDELSGLHHLDYYAAMWGIASTYVETVVGLLHMEGYIKKKVGTYSLGMRQRLCFALVLVTQANFMLLDEVMNGLDPDNVQLISDILIELKKQGKTMIIASHLLDNLDSIADKIYFIKDCRFPIIYQPQNQDLETMLLTFHSNSLMRDFVAEYGDGINVNRENRQILVEIGESEEKLVNLLAWVSGHLTDLQEIRVGKKGSYQLYKELYN
ncbi:TPA: ABC transporter ATP-binding protein [Streptococcus suis]|nr:ABC transporter ATP-binding protein [Streptococcus suis]